MRTFGKILIPVFLSASLSILVNHVFVSYDQPLITVFEDIANDTGSPNFNETETSAEEDNPFCLLLNSSHDVFLTGNSLFSPHSAMPPELCLSIWLPPDKSM